MLKKKVLEKVLTFDPSKSVGILRTVPFIGHWVINDTQELQIPQKSLSPFLVVENLLSPWSVDYVHFLVVVMTSVSMVKIKIDHNNTRHNNTREHIIISDFPKIITLTSNHWPLNCFCLFIQAARSPAPKRTFKAPRSWFFVSGIPSQRASNAESIFMWSCCQHDLRFLGIILSPRSGYYVLRLVAMITSLSLMTNCLVNNRALFQYQGCLSGIGIPIIKMRWFWYVELVHYKDEMVMIHWVDTGHIFKGSHWDPLNMYPLPTLYLNQWWIIVNQILRNQFQ